MLITLLKPMKSNSENVLKEEKIALKYSELDITLHRLSLGIIFF